MSQTRTQRYAGRAMAHVRRIAEGSQQLQKEYKTRAHSFPAMVMQSGLTQALGFLRAKSQGNLGPAYRAYAQGIAEVLGKPDADALHQESIGAELPQYRRLTREVLEVAIMIRRFAQIELQDDDQPSNEVTHEHPSA